MPHNAAGIFHISPAFLYLIDRIQAGDYVLWGDPSDQPENWTLETVTSVTRAEIVAGEKRFARIPRRGIELGYSLEPKAKQRIMDIFILERDSSDVYEHLSRLFRIAPGDQVTWCFKPGDRKRKTEPVVEVQKDEIITPTKRFFRWNATEVFAQQQEAAWICEVTPLLEPGS